MYKYQGKNPESNETITKEFDDDFVAINYARENADKYPRFSVRNSQNQLIDSDEMARIDKENAMDNMFPDEDSLNGFDLDDFFDKD